MACKLFKLTATLTATRADAGDAQRSLAEVAREFEIKADVGGRP
jgi:hypothetical protein